MLTGFPTVSLAPDRMPCGAGCRLFVQPSSIAGTSIRQSHHPNIESVDVEAIIDGIRRWVEIESPTGNVTGVNALMDCAASSVEGLDVRVERTAGGPHHGDILKLATCDAGERGGILVLSHLDTVHPLGTLSGPLPFRREGDRLYGPGIYDMKGGAYLALEAFHAVVRGRTSRLPIVFMLTSDEEVGSPTSRPLIEAEARRARHVLVTEPARDGGKVVTARKGVGRFEAITTGIAAHSGGRHRDGRSAIREMAHQILAIEAMTDYGRGVTTTVGMVSGGTAANVIPQQCRISIDLRVRDVETGRELEQRILGLRPVDGDVKLEVRGGMNRPPYRKSDAIDALYRHARGLAAELGFELGEVPMTGGGSDGNFSAALGVATLDGLGIDGDGAHTHREYALISSIAPRMLLMRRLFETLQ
jgi:glutamate carboxypeptidase